MRVRRALNRQPTTGADGAAAAFAGAGAGAAAPASITTTTEPSLTLSPSFTRSSTTVPAASGRHLHRGLVGFERDERLFLRHHVADLDQHFDDRDVLVADVRDFSVPALP